MKENQIQTETTGSENTFVPTEVDNTEVINESDVSTKNSAEIVDEVTSTQESGQSQADPVSELILGKFKSVDDLAKAYEELQKQQGSSSQELGQLRKTALKIDEAKNFMEKFQSHHNEALNYLSEVRKKYDSPEYFQDAAFEQIFNEAFLNLGYQKLDVDKFVGLLDGYVSSRITAHEKKNSATKETQQILESMGYNKNPKNSLTPPKKRLDEMTPQEIDDMLDRLI